jgi:hypothetical protein
MAGGNVRFVKILTAAASAGVVVLVATVGPAVAETATYLVRNPQLVDGNPSTPSATDVNWYREDTRPGGTTTLTKEFGAPVDLGDGSLKLTTDSTDDAKAQAITRHRVRDTLLATVTNLSYWTYQSLAAGATTESGPSLQLRVDIDGDLNTTGDVTNLVYEPYWNDTEGPAPQQPLAPDTWQFWNATNGQWWSTKRIECPLFVVEPGGGGPPFTTPSAVGTSCFGSRVVAFGVNVGTFNPSYVVGVDGLRFQTLVDDFTWNFGPK